MSQQIKDQEDYLQVLRYERERLQNEWYEAQIRFRVMEGKYAVECGKLEQLKQQFNKESNE